MVDAVKVPVGLTEVRLHREGAPDLHKVNVFSEIRDCLSDCAIFLVSLFTLHFLVPLFRHWMRDYLEKMAQYDLIFGVASADALFFALN